MLLAACVGWRSLIAAHALPGCCFLAFSRFFLVLLYQKGVPSVFPSLPPSLRRFPFRSFIFGSGRRRFSFLAPPDFRRCWAVFRSTLLYILIHSSAYLRGCRVRCAGVLRGACRGVGCLCAGAPAACAHGRGRGIMAQNAGKCNILLQYAIFCPLRGL